MMQSLTTQQAIEHYKRILDALNNGYLPDHDFNGINNRINANNAATDFTAYSTCIRVHNTGYTTITDEMSAIMDQVGDAYRRNCALYDTAYNNALAHIRAQYASKKLYERIRINGKRRYVRV